MQSIASIVGATLSGKDTYPEWWRKVKSAFIYNDLWDGICEGSTIETEVGNPITIDPRPPESEKEKAIWRTKDKKALAVITATVSEEVSQHILPARSCFEALKILKELYDSHSEMEVIQLMLKLFSLEVKDNDPMLVASEIKAIMHKIQATGMKPDLPLQHL